MKYLLFISIVVRLTSAIHTEWKTTHGSAFIDTNSAYPLESSYHGSIAAQYQPQSLLGAHASDQCELYKVGFLQDLYFQYIQYKTEMSSMKEFTLCMWTKFTNHSNDHPLFSYAVDNQPRAIYSWISNTDRSSYYSLSVNGHTFYRLNYPIRLNRWYHSCQSWNGRTGEWQIWVNAERVGRGFHNRLVGHPIPSGGIAITGQEQTQYGGGFLEGAGAPKGSGGMLGEVTMVQLYSVALTAGKAHKDHKHHHAHHYDHNGQAITTPPPPPTPPRATQATHPLLTAGQINPALNLNLANPQQPQFIPGTLPNGQDYNAQLINGQFVGNLVTQQLLGLQPPQSSIGLNFGLSPRGNGPQVFGNQQQQLQQRPLSPSLIQTFSELSQQPLPGSGLVHPSLVNPANVQFIDATIPNHQLFKRNNQGEGTKGAKAKTVVKRQLNDAAPQKRELILSGGSVLDEGLIGYDPNLIGLATFGGNQPVIQQQRSSDEREPAEAEVMAVMNVCSSCDEEPFGKALLFGWRDVYKKLYSGAIYSPAVPQCRVF